VIRLYDNDDDSEIGRITEAQLDFLQEQLIEETLDANTYAVSPATVDSLEMNGADSDVVEMLRKAIGTRTSIELRVDSD
jgi:hypothetical protein